MALKMIGLDADDTLWHNETLFRMTHERFNELLADYADPANLEAELEAVEKRNLYTYGYGAKGFTLSMLETALKVSDRKVAAKVLDEILSAGRELMDHPVEPLPGVLDALEDLAPRGRLVLITKGDLFHQESKLAASGLGSFFSGVEVVSEKNPETYRSVFKRQGVEPDNTLMAGNSVRSDILPVLETGGYAALIPYPLVWSHEAAETPTKHPRFRELERLSDLVAWVEEL